MINFVGGWLGYNCKTVSTVNQELFKRGAHYPGESIWLYGDWDHIYPLFHSRENLPHSRQLAARAYSTHLFRLRASSVMRSWRVLIFGVLSSVDPLVRCK